MRQLPAALIDAIYAGEASLRLLVSLDHPDGVVRVWSGAGVISFEGNDWHGVSGLGRIEGINASGQIAENEVTFILSGVDPRTMGLAGTGLRNRVATVIGRWQAADGSWWDYSTVLWQGLMDYGESDEADGSATLTIVARSPISDWHAAANIAWTHEAQIAEHPDDTGLDRIPELVNKEFEEWLAA